MPKQDEAEWLNFAGDCPCFGKEGSLRMCCYTDPLAAHTSPEKHQKSGVGDVASEQLVIDCFGTSCSGAEE